MRGRVARVNECGHPDRPHKGHGMCASCHRKTRNRSFTPEQREAWLVRDREYGRREYQRVKVAKAAYHKRMREDTWNMLFDHYGRVCACCGEDNPIFLTLDHMNGDGAEHRRSIGGRSGYNLHRHVVVNGFPSGFQILCYNCNCGRAKNNGVCPHKESVNGNS